MRAHAYSWLTLQVGILNHCSPCAVKISLVAFVETIILPLPLLIWIAQSILKPGQETGLHAGVCTQGCFCFQTRFEEHIPSLPLSLLFLISSPISFSSKRSLSSKPSWCPCWASNSSATSLRASSVLRATSCFFMERPLFRGLPLPKCASNARSPFWVSREMDVPGENGSERSKHVTRM